MNYEQEQQIVSEIKKYVTDYLPLSKISDEELEDEELEPLPQLTLEITCPLIPITTDDPGM